MRTNDCDLQELDISSKTYLEILETCLGHMLEIRPHKLPPKPIRIVADDRSYIGIFTCHLGEAHHLGIFQIRNFQAWQLLHPHRSLY